VASCSCRSFIYATSVASSIGLTIEGSSFSGLLTRGEVGHMRIGLAGKGRIAGRNRRSRRGIITRRQNDRHTIMDVG
jgi:hypothetical protein